MTNTKTTKRALFSSIMALILCFSMLLGTTFAWFTDSVTSGGNIIQAGVLDVEMYYADGSKEVPTTISGDWNDAANVAIYKAEQLWEPGYIDAKHIKIVNAGTLALKYKLAIVPHVDEVISALADVIDVYLFETAQKVDRATATSGTKLGTLREVMATSITTGDLVAKDSRTATIVLKMREEAGNEYQGLTIGTDFSIQLIATQFTVEDDSFDNQYDVNAEWPYISAPVVLAEDTATPLKTENGVETELPADLVNKLKDESITSVSLACSEPVYDAGTGTLTFDSIEILDQNGKEIDLTDNTQEFTVTIPAGGIADGTDVVIYHDNVAIGSATVAGGQITYTAKHFCKVEIKHFDNAVLVDNVDALKEEIKKTNANIVVLSGTYDMGGNFSIAEGVTMIGEGEVTLKGTLTSTLKNVRVSNIAFTGGNAQRWAYAKGNVVFENCTFNATSVYALHFDGTSGADITYKNCTIIGWAAIAGGQNSLTFDGCEIFGNGTYGLIRTYSDATIKNCTFDVAKVNTTDAYQDGIHALDCTITVENCTNVNGSVEDIFNTSGSGIIAYEGVQYVYSCAGLQRALDNATGETSILLRKNIVGDVIATQKEGVNITIDGDGNDYSGTIYIHGYARYNGAETLTIQNIDFVANETMDFISSNTTAPTERYAHNVTVKDCTFTSTTENGVETVAVRFRQAYNITVEDCRATGMHSLMWATGCTGIFVDNVTLDNCLNGISVGTSNNVQIMNSTIKAEQAYGYGVRANISGTYNVDIQNCSIKADAPVLLREATGEAIVNFKNNMLTTTGEYQLIITDSDYAEGKDLAAPTGKYTITGADDYIVFNGVVVVSTADELAAALSKGWSVILANDIKIDPANMSNAYGTTGLNVLNGQSIDGNGYILDIKGAGGTWDTGINTTGGLIKDITVTGSFRGIFVNHNSDHSERVILENVTIEGTTYTISCDQGKNQGLTATDSTFNGWTSFAGTIGDAKFVDCSFGEGNGYAYCRPYAPTEFVGCDFEAGYELDARAAVTFENCTIGGVALTAENLATLVISNIANASVK